ncbi:retropepsin-like aspartic protease [Leeuwenhoekiella sp. A16]|uniref:retropepsin-like aspartic protease n=1 Tax=unclassified Leeuwenhoekiella TaxID=2615029 RepID=UPI003A7FCD68|tara:strand:+ start:789 stop:1229 length:441 start_codon:yes stop_codon:yes gene_type:complete
MTTSLRRFLTQKNYVRVPLTETGTGHLEFKATINNIEGTFILDTGASSSCVGFEGVEKFKLFAKESEVKAAGAGAIDMLTQISQNNIIQIGKWTKKNAEIVLFDLSHVNTALENHKAEPVNGIIGADILREGQAVIDYQYNCFYIK